MSEQEFMKQTASIFCQDPKIRQNQHTKERMQQYDQILCQTLGKRYPVQQSQTIQEDLQYSALPQQNTLLDSFIKNLLMSDKGALFVYNEQQNQIPQRQNNIIKPQCNIQRDVQQYHSPQYNSQYNQNCQQSERYFGLSQRLQNNIKQNQVSEQKQIYVPIIKNKDFGESQLFTYSNIKFEQWNDQPNDQIYCFNSIEESKRRRKEQMQNFKHK